MMKNLICEPLFVCIIPNNYYEGTMGVEMSHFVLVKNLISDDVQKGNNRAKRKGKNINFYPLNAAGCCVFHRLTDTSG
jgi:hypothetical protein